MDDNTVSVSSLPDSFIDWMNETRRNGVEQRAPFLRRYMLQIPEYVEWMKERKQEDGIQ